ncbi:MAG: efflux RND transporter periplasmic adaptor subunit [Deltaproteobacteria bacterium]|nr:efflux RND transporter periplasmic adaptor subunit [Deltaproteobacteria bacterium]
MTIGLCLFLVFLALQPLGCQKNEVETAKEKTVNVRVLPVETRSFRPFVETVGSLSPDEQVIISSEVDGVLRTVRVDEGSAVARGMVLAEIDDTDYRLDLLRSKAVLKQAEATLENTRVEHQRKDALYREDLVTKQQFDDVSTRLALAEAERERARATLALAEQRLSKTRIRAPMAGFVKEKRSSAGDFVRGGLPLFTLIRTDPLKLIFTVTEKDFGKLHIGQDLSFRVDAYPKREFTGRLSLISPSLDERTRTLAVEAQVPNPGHVLKPGLFARVTLYTGPAREAAVVPATSILYDDSRTRVFVVEGNKAKQREVKTGNIFDEWVEISEGLKIGEQLVVVGQNNLVDGVKVHVAR